MSEEELRAKSEWNGASSYFVRLDKLFSIIAACKLQRPIEIYDWMMALDTLFVEISTYMSEAEIIKAKKDLNDIRLGVGKATQNRNYMKGQVPGEVVDQLREFDLFLRKTCDKAGLLLKMQEDAHNALR